MYWRDEENREVDFVIERDGKLLAVEVKATTRPSYGDWRHLRHFTSEYRKTGLVDCCCTAVMKLSRQRKV